MVRYIYIVTIKSLPVHNVFLFFTPGTIHPYSFSTLKKHAGLEACMHH